MYKKSCPLSHRGSNLQLAALCFTYSDLNPFINLFIIEMDDSSHCRIQDGLFYLVIVVTFPTDFAFIIVHIYNFRRYILTGKSTSITVCPKSLDHFT